MSEQANLEDFRSPAPTETTTITRTVKCKLETSQRKNDRLRECIECWQKIADHVADLMPTFPLGQWGNTNNTHLTYIVKRDFADELDENLLRAHDAYQAAYKVTEAFGSWDSNNRPGERPQFGDGSYFRMCHCGVKEIDENDRGYGIKLGMQPYKPEWFHIDAGAYQRQYLDAIVNDEADTGSAEVHLTNDGEAFLHLTVKTDVEVYEPAGVSRYVGVDLGERILYAIAAVAETDSGTEVKGVQMESGREFRHHRERLARRRDELQEKDDLRGVREVSGERLRYTEHVLDSASREIVDFALDHAPSALVLEDLTDYRETADDPIHDWPYAELQEKIAYKATAEGIPVIDGIDAAGTSTTCRKCGNQDPTYRDGTEFVCRRCGYEVHADVNAAINIATNGL